MKSHILIVEDEADLLSTLQYNFTNEGYQVTLASLGGKAIKIIEAGDPPDIVILDLMLPDISGLDVCKHIKNNPKHRDILVLILTAKGEEIDRISGLEIGADDYLVKPFSLRELSLRVSALLKRNKNTQPKDNITIGNLHIDIESHRILLNENEINLTAKEFKLIHYLARHNGKAHSRETLLYKIWGYNADITTRTLDTHIKRLRSKLGEFSKNIETVRSIGYRLNYKKLL
ncbi:MAG: two-component system phosphate regulon response regulator PhoB [Woeseiaceae bacterium]|jgi:two-component system phosphate regulon response regulator PhoB|tara:strand:- start:21388 stop:22080 length:693 start_codon:yes stop_codon:yes gene_type:complete